MSQKSRSASGRTTSQRHPLLVNRPQGVFYPDAVGVVPNYPKTPEAFEAMCVRLRANWQKAIAANGGRIPTRRGVPDGWADRKPELKRIRETAKVNAKKVLEAMLNLRMIDDDEKGNLAIEAALEMILARAEKPGEAEGGAFLYGPDQRLKAMKLVAEYTKAKPAQRVEARLDKAEDFLALVALDSKR